MSVQNKVRGLPPALCLEMRLMVLPTVVRGFAALLHLVCDDEGRASAHPTVLRGALCPLDPDVTDDLITEWLLALDDAGYIRIYQAADGWDYLQLMECPRVDKGRPSRIPPAPPGRPTEETAPVRSQPAGDRSHSTSATHGGTSARPVADVVRDGSQQVTTTHAAGVEGEGEGEGEGERGPRESESEPGVRVWDWAEGGSESAPPSPSRSPTDQKTRASPGKESSPGRARRGARASTREETRAALLAMAEPPEPFCCDHPAGTDEPCGPCGTARKRADLWFEIHDEEAA